MKVDSLSTHHSSDGGVGEVFESTKPFRSFRGKQSRSQIQYNSSKWWKYSFYFFEKWDFSAAVIQEFPDKKPRINN